MANVNINVNDDMASVLAKHVVNVHYENLSKEVIEATKKSILDTIGVMLGASGTMPEIAQLVAMVKEAGGRKESTIVGFGGQVPAWMAAFANAAMAHCLDYDDLHHDALLHPSSPVLTAGFAIAERMGKASGKEFITAIALGIDLASRLGLSINWKLDWNPTTVCGVFSAAATSGKLLGLDRDQIVNAFSIALCQSAGTVEVRGGVGSNLGGLRDAFPAKGGVLSAIMAQIGITGIKSSFEGKAGFLNVYFKGDYNRAVLTTDLGKRFKGVEVGFKPWPACGFTHNSINATLRLVSKHDIRPADIEEITVWVDDSTQNLCQPLEARRQPETTADAKFSIPFSVAVAAARRKVVIKDYTQEGLKDPVVLSLARKVTPKLVSQTSFTKGSPRGTVAIRSKAGKTYRASVNIPYGHPRNPISTEELINKFRDCASYSARPIPKKNVEKVIELVTGLENVDDVTEIMRLVG